MTTSTQTAGHPPRLVVCGWIEQVRGEVARGMRVLAQDGSRVGVVAALVQTSLTPTITHLLLGQVPPTATYRLISLDLLDRLDGEGIWLCLPPQQITTLPLYQPDS
jgi:hypothetical protein